MASVFYKTNLISSACLLLFAILLYSQGSAELSLNQLDENHQDFWKVLETAVHPDGSSIDLNEDYEVTNAVEEEYGSDELEDIEERHVEYPESRAVIHKVCKVRTIPVRLPSNGYEYSTTHYKNLTCEETADKPLERKGAHYNEYCLIVHHPHERVSCQTKHIRVPIFRRKNRKHHWEKMIHSVAVGCDCSVGLKYL